ncbi:MAG: glycosyltransferase family 2 protein [Vicinamibacteria bacterium]|jgi:GT2 family glycosyltransferase|nr:glycosyltransferase family 2 protein [Vicinamibacteria bacterium]
MTLDSQTAQPNAPVVAAIVVNFNGAGYVEDAVESLLAQDLPGVEVWVVDNGSTDGSDDKLVERFNDRIRLIRLGRNTGFGAGNNVAIRASTAPYILLLNNDAIAEPSLARELVACAEADPRVGMVAPKVLRHDQRTVLDTIGHLMTADGLNRGRGRLEPDQQQYDQCREALFPSGAAALYRRAMLDEIGLFDEYFFLYGDDADLGLRGRLAGWGCAFTPQAIAYHRYSQSAGPYSSLKAFYVERNRVFVLVKLFPLPLLLLSPFATVLRLALHLWGAMRGLGAAGWLARERNTPALIGIVLHAYLSALKGLPHILKERWRFRACRRLSTRDVWRLLRAYPLTAQDAALKD